jgi:GT2 family glycosyltransferase
VTHQNETNSFVGGGIRDCIQIAESRNADYVFYCVNDVEILDRLLIADFQAVMENDPEVVMVSCSLSPDSAQATTYPWMVQRRDRTLRRVRYADAVCGLIRLDFIRGFGGFPESLGGWGYSREMAYHARKLGKKILVNDRCAVRHTEASEFLVTTDGRTVSKAAEAFRVYAARYGHILEIRSSLAEPDFDEALDLA